MSSEDQLHSSGDEQHREDTDELTLDKSSKRSRTNISNQKTPRKKYIKGKQGGLQGIMKMPLEVFMEIAYYAHPGDLVSLIRTNKFFRAMLLNKSATSIWQRALSYVPSLPPCPTGMVEPQYAALMFSKNCTLCGAQATSKPDPFLQVRLCSSCRDTGLEEILPGATRVRGAFVPWTTQIKKFKQSTLKHPAYCLLAQSRKLERMEKEFICKNDQIGLAEWKTQRRTSWDNQLKEGKRLLEYLNLVAASRLDELKDLKSERREQIHERLRALGWEDKYFDIHKESAEKQWKSLVEVSKPFTERAWKNMLPKLTQLLEENRVLVDEYHRQQRRYARVIKAQDLLRQLKRDTHPYQSIVDTLQLERPPIVFGSFSMGQEPALSSPFPANQVVRGWDFFANLYEEENSTERVEDLFKERRDMICQKLLDWQAQVENQLVEQYKAPSTGSTSATADNDTILTIQGSTDPTKHISNNARFLLRAVTVFVLKVTRSFSEVDQAHGPIADHVHFPDIPCIMNDLDGYDDTYDNGFYQDIEEMPLDRYVRHAGKEAIIEALLGELQMPDVAHVELGNMGKAFICGRCNHNKAMGWNELVEHYHLKRRDWIENRFLPNTYETQHPVIFRNLHNLEPGTNPKPLVRIVQSDDNHASSSHSYKSVAECVICRGVDFYDHSSFESLTMMREHMLDMHDVAEPVEELHFVDELRRLDSIMYWAEFERRDWEQKWDRFHDA
ncbi:hypothetical protein RSOL_320170 [Rhizoctonia solani AG-3 Rhs1AP]|uniref:F-box domain-containing protein n=1 Tax=Rhizoctonia solani AG-3 Rhs1AP TaxID=1086054 RepID=A0A0A1UM46_9AGAM|nr:hypothetical protein RSOL_320170 [Rhizoctonia solani AG-3 Rhs1AP]